MTIIRRPSPFSELLSLRSAMDRLFDESFFRPVAGAGVREGTLAMPLDIYTTQDALVVEAALPGVRPEDVEVSVLGDTLTLSASNSFDQTQEANGYHVREVRRGRFSRTVTLPSGLKTDAATASFENGILKLAFPKAEQVKPRQIPVTSPTEGTARAVTAGTTDAPDASQTTDAGEQPAAG
ncbi:MAG: Hsp20/alpha crystallin family protein [Chloroflexota bacterium]